MSALIVVCVDGLFCESSFDVPGVEPDANVLRWYSNLYEGSNEQFVMTCDSPNSGAVDNWLRTLGVRFSTMLSTYGQDEEGRTDAIMKFVGAQHAKIVLFIGARLYDCNRMADRGVPSLRYTPPKSTKWEPDPRSSWVRAIEKQQA